MEQNLTRTEKLRRKRQRNRRNKAEKKKLLKEELSMLNAESFRNWGVDTCIDGKWVLARPVRGGGLYSRLKDAWEVLMGRADAVKFIGQ